jgi:hypothetical protein
MPRFGVDIRFALNRARADWAMAHHICLVPSSSTSITHRRARNTRMRYLAHSSRTRASFTARRASRYIADAPRR